MMRPSAILLIGPLCSLALLSVASATPATGQKAGLGITPGATKLHPSEPWWSLRPITRPALPTVKNTDWCRTPIDRFILVKLELKGLAPSPPADRRTLIRRATFDVTGLPPTPEEVDAFLTDKSPNAYEKVIDRLLASPRYGERWGRHWLDVVHYGDTHGYDKDKRRDNAWPYRDYVIRSLNQDKPYARLVKEQVAGDVLYPESPDGIIATGFIAAGPWDFVGQVELAEGTVEKEKTRLLDRDDMVANTLSTFNSVTVHCARCHDHKFDPVPSRDYYRLQAVFAGVDRGDRPYADPQPDVRAKLEQRAAQLQDRKKLILQRVAEQAKPTVEALERRIAEGKRELERHLPVTPSPTNGYHSAISARQDVEKWVQVDLGKPQVIGFIRLYPARPTDFPDTPGFGFPLRFRVQTSNDADFSSIVHDYDRTAQDYPNPGSKVVEIGIPHLSARYVRVTAYKLWTRTEDYVFALGELQVGRVASEAGPDRSFGKRYGNVALSTPVTALDSIEAGRWSKAFLVDGYDSRYALPGGSDLGKALQQEAAMFRLEEIRRLEAERASAASEPKDTATRDELAQTQRDLAEVERQLKALPPPQKVYAVLPRVPRPINVLSRGDVEAPMEPAGPGALACVQGLPAQFTTDTMDEGGRRAALAGWITSPKNVLTWRSIVNRVWHYHFGKGIVDTPNDFGRNGSLPTHPQLLDWLATTFLENGQSLKKLHRLILLSAVYRQASAHNAAYARMDGDNRLLWHQSRRRLDVEAIRDSVLAVSGKLDLTMGGPGFELFRFKDDHSPVYDHTAIENITDPKTYRRTVYAFLVRSVQNPFLECLDCADPSINTPVRNTTLTALQALALLNDPFIIKQSEFMAERLARVAGPEPARQIERAYRLALGRPPSPVERKTLTDYSAKHGLANACRILFNMNEFVFVD
jgi:hypothetical protein